MKKVLIIEDDKGIAELERDYLEANGFEVQMAFTGLSGKKAALSSPVDLILLDIMLPGEDGFQVCREIRAEKDIPILMVSPQDRKISIKSGDWDWVPTTILSNPLVQLNSWPGLKAIFPVMNS